MLIVISQSLPQSARQLQVKKPRGRVIEALLTKLFFEDSWCSTDYGKWRTRTADIRLWTDSGKFWLSQYSRLLTFNFSLDWTRGKSVVIQSRWLRPSCAINIFSNLFSWSFYTLLGEWELFCSEWYFQSKYSKEVVEVCLDAYVFHSFIFSSVWLYNISIIQLWSPFLSSSNKTRILLHFLEKRWVFSCLLFLSVLCSCVNYGLHPFGSFHRHRGCPHIRMAQ